MNTKTLTASALQIIDQYQHFHFGSAVASIPYFNNKTIRARAALKAQVGKGSTTEITDELEAVVIENGINKNALADEALKKLLVDSNLGIDCSGFAYYILAAETKAKTAKNFAAFINLIHCKGLIGKFFCKLRPEANCDVLTFADDRNSHTINTKDIRPGDIITIFSDREEHKGTRNHIAVVHQVDYKDDIPMRVYYSHAIAYPEDGEYGTGIKQGTIDIIDPNADILEQSWEEKNLQKRASEARCELRRMNWL